LLLPVESTAAIGQLRIMLALLYFLDLDGVVQGQVQKHALNVCMVRIRGQGIVLEEIIIDKVHIGNIFSFHRAAAFAANRG